MGARLIRIVTALGPSTETWLFVALYLGFFGALALALRAPAEARAVRGAAAAVLGAAALLAGALLFGRAQLERVPFGIVLPDALAVKEGADLNYRTSFDVHAGLRVRIVEQDRGLGANSSRQRPRRLGTRPRRG